MPNAIMLSVGIHNDAASLSNHWRCNDIFISSWLKNVPNKLDCYFGLGRKACQGQEV